MSKASEKRAIEQYNRVNSTMKRATITLRERYYASTVYFHTQQLQDGIDILNEKREDTTDSREIKDIDQSIRRVQSQLDNQFTNQLVWVADAKSSFDAKLENVSQKLVQFGLAEGRLQVEKTWIESAQEMSFMITSTLCKYNSGRSTDLDLGTAHARLIWVNCTEKASHFRFITTLVGKPGTTANPTEEKVVEVDTKQSKKEQIMILFNAGKSTKNIQELIGGNISYIRNTIRLNK